MYISTTELNVLSTTTTGKQKNKNESNDKKTLQLSVALMINMKRAQIEFCVIFILKCLYIFICSTKYLIIFYYIRQSNAIKMYNNFLRYFSILK